MTEPKWRPRLLALDIDGTLVDYDGVMPESLRVAVQRVLAADIPIVIATGRSWPGARPIVEALQLPAGEHICSNGAVAVSYPEGRITKAITFDPAPIISAVRREAPTALIAVEDPDASFRLSADFPVGELNGPQQVVPVAELAARPVTRVVVRDPAATEETFVTLAQRLGLQGVGYFVGWAAWLDICPEGIDKAHGLADVCQKLGIAAADVLAIGDGRNDIAMLQWAGRGVALGDATDDVKSVADHVTADFAADGTATELLRWV
ncbi:MAG: HAD family hydrolase [Propionibacteriaceae bacterium]